MATQQEQAIHVSVNDALQTANRSLVLSYPFQSSVIPRHIYTSNYNVRSAIPFKTYTSYPRIIGYYANNNQTVLCVCAQLCHPELHAGPKFGTRPDPLIGLSPVSWTCPDPIHGPSMMDKKSQSF